MTARSSAAAKLVLVFGTSQHCDHHYLVMMSPVAPPSAASFCVSAILCYCSSSIEQKRSAQYKMSGRFIKIHSPSVIGATTGTGTWGEHSPILVQGPLPGAPEWKLSH